MEPLSKEIIDQIKEQNRIGNPAKPEGEAGDGMLDRMNEHHFEVTGWGLSFGDFKDGEAVLDIGCGGGATIHRLHAQLPSSIITGMDYSDLSLAKSISYNKQAVENGSVKVVYGSVEAMPFESDSFDKIVTVESFYFWPNHVESLKEVKRVLKKGGRFLLIADIYDCNQLTEEQLENIRDYNLFNPKPEEFITLFEEAGFCDIETHFKDGEIWICVSASK